jgi:transcriptional regulator
MYAQPAFRETRLEVLHGAMAAHPLAALVTHGAAGLEVSHVPLLLDPAAGPNGTLYGHLARANPQVGTVGEALAVFQGPQAYVSPSWYATKTETGKVVPTWNYVAVHARGPMTWIEDPVALRALVERLTDRHEAGRAKPWAVSDAPDDYVATMLRAIVGIAIPILRIEGTWKMSQNRPQADRSGVARGLADDGHVAVAAEVEARDPALNPRPRAAAEPQDGAA